MKTLHDVVIVGAGIAGTTLASCLARNGVDVVVVDAGVQPKFAIGESTIPYTSALLRLLSDRYHVPELRALATFQGVRRNVTIAGGIKKNFGFLHHEADVPVSQERANQFVIPGFLSHENHLFRQDIDTYLLNTAVKYGAQVRQGMRVLDVDICDNIATVRCDPDITVRARYVVDASGLNSALVEKLELREEPTRLVHRSRSIFTHMYGVTPFEATDDGRRMDGIPSRWSEGTLHHVFDGGWIWVIPFNNWKGGANPLVSVGLTVDSDRFPRGEQGPEREFYSIIDQFPSVRAQFSSAVAVRPWVSTGRLQHSLHTTVGDNFCVTAHAAGFIDALYSRGLSNTFMVINALADRLIAARRSGDYSRERFKYIETLEQSLLDNNDDLVHGSFVSFQDYDMWNAYFRLWGLSTVLGTFDLQARIARLRGGDGAALAELESARWPGSPFPGHEGVNSLLAQVKSIVREVDNSTLDTAAASRRIFGVLDSAEFIPDTLGFTRPENRFFHVTPPKAARTVRWARTRAPEDISGVVVNGIRSLAEERLRG